MSDLYEDLGDRDILCACETWSTNPDLKLISTKLRSTVSPAVKVNHLDRAKGGLLLSYNPDVFEAENIVISSNYIFVKM